MVRDVVYFGRNRPDGGTVSDAEWEAYLDSVVTPRFPAGFTVVEAEGHWRGERGVVERERTEVLTLLHPGDEASREAVRALTEEYIRRFHQEAVSARAPRRLRPLLVSLGAPAPGARPMSSAPEPAPAAPPLR